MCWGLKKLFAIWRCPLFSSARYVSFTVQAKKKNKRKIMGVLLKIATFD